MIKQHHFPKNTSGPSIQRPDDNSKTTTQLIGLEENTKERMIDWAEGGKKRDCSSAHKIRPGTKGKEQGKRQM